MDVWRSPTIGVEDLVLLPQLSDQSICENLRIRHARDLIYTNIGPVLLAVNPFKAIPGLYGPAQITYYRQGGSAVAARETVDTAVEDSRGGVGPSPSTEVHIGGAHIFALAENTYRTMITEEENQCVIISGESGAGKTEASKQIMLYISAVSGNTPTMERVKHIILQANPLMEAFGNAKTLRNDNSSRFGKFFQVYFDALGGPVGGRMDTFLLEKSRVVGQQRGERNFHVFYQLCAGATPEQRARLRLGDASAFHYLSQGDACDRLGSCEATEWDLTQEAMNAVGMAEVDRERVVELLAIILHLGQVHFCDSASDRSDDPCTVEDTEALDYVAQLMGIDPAVLLRAMTWKRLEVGSSEVVDVPLDVQQCRNTRDAIAKAMYDALFVFIVNSVNHALGDTTHALMLGVLDIYGFEIFDRNGFEQLCINYVNEKLQQIFIELTLRVEQEEYVRERIPWEGVKFFDNKGVLDLLEGCQPPGLFLVLDDVCATMAKEQESVADVKLLDKLAQGRGGSESYFIRTETGFVVKHYAGNVTYHTSGFTARNKDRLLPDVRAMLSACAHPLLLEVLTPLLMPMGSPASRPASRHAGKETPATATATTAYKLRQQAADLVATLKQCNPHYIRTIKTNDEKRAGSFDVARVLHQVKYLGLLENIRVRRAGYSYRQYYDRFIRRFKYICSDTFPLPYRGSDRNACEAILRSAEPTLPEGSWHLGVSKVFIRQPMHLTALEGLLAKAFDVLASKIQRTWTAYHNSKAYVQYKMYVKKLYDARNKSRRADSVFRPYAGDYLDVKTRCGPLLPFLEHDPVGSAWREVRTDSIGGGSSSNKRYYANLLTLESQWAKPLEMSPYKLVFSSKVSRCSFRRLKTEMKAGRRSQSPPTASVASGAAFTEQQGIYCILTDRALFLIQEVMESIASPPALKRTGKSSAREDPILAPVMRQRLLLLKRIDVRLFAAVSVTAQADDVIVLHTLPTTPPYRPVRPTPVKARAKQCESCGRKLTPAASKGHCPCCGRWCCARHCLTHPTPLPSMLGHDRPVRVCPRCVVGEPREPNEDLVLRTPLRSELMALLAVTYHHRMGSPLPLQVSDVISFQLYGETTPRTLQAVRGATESLTVTSLYAPDAQTVLVEAPNGIAPQIVLRIEAAREDRRRRADLRRRTEEEEQRRQEAVREAERAEQHRQAVATRKALKAEADKRAEADRLAREEAVRMRREAAAKIVAQQARKQL